MSEYSTLGSRVSVQFSLMINEVFDKVSCDIGMEMYEDDGVGTSFVCKRLQRARYVISHIDHVRHSSHSSIQFKIFEKKK